MKLCEMLALINPDTSTIVVTDICHALIPSSVERRIKYGYMDMIVTQIYTERGFDHLIVEVHDPAEEVNNV